MPLSQRVADRVARDYSGQQRAQVIDLMAGIGLGSSPTAEGDERVHAAILKVANGNIDRLLDAVVLAETDWRDVLVSAGFENEDWRGRVEEWFGPDPLSSG